MKIKVTCDKWQVTRTVRAANLLTRHSSLITRFGFTLVEVMVVVVLLSLIVLALMAVFDSTQKAFRASITQTDVLEGSRAALDLMADDLREMSPSFGQSNAIAFDPLNRSNNVNFCVSRVNNFISPPSPLIQPLIASSASRTNMLENFFILSRGNNNGVPTWYGTGYAVGTNSADGSLYPLYRFYMSTNMASGTPAALFNTFALLQYTNAAVWSHLMDGVVDLTARAFDVNGEWMTNNSLWTGGQPMTFGNGRWTTNKNVYYFAPQWGETGFYMFSNTLPSSVEIEMGVLEDRTLQRAESLSGSFSAQTNYLAGAAGQVHIFRQRVTIPNFDPSAYQ